MVFRKKGLHRNTGEEYGHCCHVTNVRYFGVKKELEHPFILFRYAGETQPIKEILSNTVYF